MFLIAPIYNVILFVEYNEEYKYSRRFICKLVVPKKKRYWFYHIIQTRYWRLNFTYIEFLSSWIYFLNFKLKNFSSLLIIIHFLCQKLDRDNIQLHRIPDTEREKERNWMDIRLPFLSPWQRSLKHYFVEETHGYIDYEDCTAPH